MRALHALISTADREQKPESSKLLAFLCQEISSGKKISEAVHGSGQAFPRYVSGVLKAAEESGKLDDALAFLAHTEEKEMKLKGQLKEALSYPLGVAVVTSVIFLVLAWFLRGLTEVFEGIGASIPVYLQFLINLANFTFTPWPFLVLGLGGFAFYKLFQSAKFRRKLRDRSKDLGLPIFSRVMVLSANIHFCRLLSMQLEAGCSLLPALTRALQGSDDRTLTKQADAKKKGTIVWKVINGIELHKALDQSGYFTNHLVSMLRIAEESGSVPKTLLAVANFLQSELDYRFEQFTTLVQPVFMVVLGGIVGLIAVGTFVPLLEVMNK